LKYIFDTAPVEQENYILYKIEQEFKLFEDVAPPNKPIVDLLPRLFTEQQLAVLREEKDFNP
jgi:hypothetical protein